MHAGTLKTIAATVAVLLTLFILSGFAILYSGVYNVAATADHVGLTRWVLSTAQANSVSARADEVPPAPALDQEALSHGFEHFDAMCVTCHGAPGVDPGEFGQGITPTPPELSVEAAEWSADELFWITKNGIKLAGMPAFGPTHSDEEIWGIVAFLQRLSGMSPEEYQQWVDHSTGGGGEESAGHHHSPGTPAHSH